MQFCISLIVSPTEWSKENLSVSCFSSARQLLGFFLFSSIQSLNYYSAAEGIKTEISLHNIQNDALQCNIELLGMVISKHQYHILYV